MVEVGSGRKMAALGRVWLQVYRLANTAQFTDFFFFFLLCQEHSRQSPRPCPDLVGLVPLYVKVKIRLKLPRLGANLCSGFLLLFCSCFQDQVFSPGLPGAH